MSFVYDTFSKRVANNYAIVNTSNANLLCLMNTLKNGNFVLFSKRSNRFIVIPLDNDFA